MVHRRNKGEFFDGHRDHDGHDRRLLVLYKPKLERCATESKIYASNKPQHPHPPGAPWKANNYPKVRSGGSEAKVRRELWIAEYFDTETDATRAKAVFRWWLGPGAKPNRVKGL